MVNNLESHRSSPTQETLSSARHQAGEIVKNFTSAQISDFLKLLGKSLKPNI